MSFQNFDIDEKNHFLFSSCFKVINISYDVVFKLFKLFFYAKKSLNITSFETLKPRDYLLLFATVFSLKRWWPCSLSHRTKRMLLQFWKFIFFWQCKRFWYTMNDQWFETNKRAPKLEKNIEGQHNYCYDDSVQIFFFKLWTIFHAVHLRWHIVNIYKLLTKIFVN